MKIFYDSNIVKPVTISEYRSIIGFTEQKSDQKTPKEFEHWSDLNERILGHICFDEESNYFYLVVLAKGSNKKFKAVDFLVGIKSLEQARKELLKKIESFSSKPDEAFDQNNEIC